MSEPMDAHAEREALLDLLRSPGWDVFQRAADALFGADASLERIDKAVGLLPLGDRDAERDAVRTLRAEARAVQLMVRWPVDRVEELKPEEKPRWMSRRRTS